MKRQLLTLSLMLTLAFWATESQAETVYNCSATNNTYADSATCSASCVQTASCTPGTAAASGGGEVMVPQFGTNSTHYWYVNVNASGNTINLGGSVIKLSGCTASGSGRAIASQFGTNSTHYWYLDVKSSGNSIVLGGKTISLNGCTASGSGRAIISQYGDESSNYWYMNSSASGNVINLSNIKISLFSSIGGYVCPLAGGSVCNGSPSICSASRSCTAINLIDSADFVRYEMPTEVNTGQAFTATVVMKNTGESTWKAGVYKLDSTNATMKGSWQITGPLQLTADALPDPTKEVKFTANMIAPAAAGTYTFGDWQMTEGSKWFGTKTPLASVTVKSVCTPSCANPDPATMCTTQTAGGNADGCGGTCPVVTGTKCCGACPVVDAADICAGSTGGGGNDGCGGVCPTVSGTKNCVNIGTFKEVAP